MIRALTLVMILAWLPAAQPVPRLSQVLACDLPFAEAVSVTDGLAVTRFRDSSEGEILDRTYFYDATGVTVLGLPVRSVARSDYRASGQVEYAFAARMNGSFEELGARLLRRYGGLACDSEAAPDGSRVCLRHLRIDPGPYRLDIDVQISESEGRLQFECLYGDLTH